MNNNKFLNTKELAAEYGIALSTQAKYRKNRFIPFIKLGGFVRYSREKIDTWLELHSFEVQSEGHNFA